ncbi:cellulose binding domain-containing protein [Actinophytocola sp.]|uniref:cellulose binding domain-containing protein n=1 Tax=Actinophytocola sp. TaxID=1872138 RepID=UPI002D2FE528|nr:cellulose binding domain-containing protein [Actinophytocola sp.]HYQ66483.1 cellulose binding domain-containing protein [Actinophytocola sp.]
MRRSRPAALLVFALAAATQVGGPPAANAAPAGVDVVVNARAGLEPVSSMALGVNHAIWDTNLGTAEVADLLKGAGVKAMRYPGGSYSDIYHWLDHTAPGGYVAPNTDFDHFMAGVRRAGAQPIVTANYGTGSPQEAADWVRSANIDKGYGVRYWEIGNENYGNGHYGSAWEADDHADKSPVQYATLVRDYATAMKAVDPTIKVGAVLTTPGEWPDGITADGDAGTWNQVVLRTAGSVIDFAIVHWYPTGSSGPEVLTKTNRTADQVRLVREQSRSYAGKELPVAMTEVNTSYGRNTQPGALFAADSYATLMANGVFNVDWWNVHNGPDTASTVAGQPDYNDFGLLSSGTCNADGTVCEPALNTPFAPYFGLSMVSRFARPGDQLVAASATDPLVKAHAARRADGGLSVLLVNQDPDAAKTVALSYTGYSPAAAAQVLTYGNGDTAITTASGAARSVTLAPYSLTTLVLRPSTSQTNLPARPGRPAADGVTDTAATISWTPPAAAGVKYELHRQLGTTSEQWGETTGQTFTVTNLKPATRYTVNLLARDNAGRVSWASPPLTFQTLTPATSACSVRFAETTDWGNGYVANVDVTNNLDHPLDPWSLTFTWPTTWQRVDSGWNATWSQTDTTVTVLGGSPLPAATTTTVGFVGNYQGPNVQPVAFRLNGTLCATV